MITIFLQVSVRNPKNSILFQTFNYEGKIRFSIINKNTNSDNLYYICSIKIHFPTFYNRIYTYIPYKSPSCVFLQELSNIINYNMFIKKFKNILFLFYKERNRHWNLWLYYISLVILAIWKIHLTKKKN